MKRKIVTLLALFCMLILVSCSSDNDDITASESTPSDGYATGEASYDIDAEMSYNEVEIYEESGMSPEQVTIDSGGGGEAKLSEIEAYDKIIYSAETNIETKTYEDTISDLNQLVALNNGFIESSSVGGVSYHSDGARYANFTIRIPSDKFTEVTNSFSTIGNVTYLNTSAHNVTPEYIDTESRLNSYRTQEERLLSMLSSAETLEEMLILESHLTDVRYNIEYYTTNLNSLKNKVDYSTIYVNIDEVIEYTPETKIDNTFLMDIQNAFNDSLENIVIFLENIVLFVIYFWYLIIIAVFVIIKLKKRVTKFANNKVQKDVPPPKEED